MPVAFTDKAPPLNNRDDLANHYWIGYVDDLLFSQEPLFLNNFCRTPTVTFRSTSVIAQQLGGSRRFGHCRITQLHGLQRPGTSTRIGFEESVQRSYWISTCRELHKSVRLRVVWDFAGIQVRKSRGVLLAP